MNKEQAFVRGYNLKVLRKLWDKLTDKDISMKDFYSEIGISETTCESICRFDEKAASRWDYKKAAKKIGIDPKVFSGELMLKIQEETETQVYFREHYNELIKMQIDNNTEKKQLSTQQIKDYKKDNMNPMVFWKTVLMSDNIATSDINDSDSWEHALWMEHLAIIDRQAREYDFYDVNIWRFLRYILLNYKK